MGGWAGATGPGWPSCPYAAPPLRLAFINTLPPFPRLFLLFQPRNPKVVHCFARYSAVKVPAPSLYLCPCRALASPNVDHKNRNKQGNHVFDMAKFSRNPPCGGCCARECLSLKSIRLELELRSLHSSLAPRAHLTTTFEHPVPLAKQVISSPSQPHHHAHSGRPLLRASNCQSPVRDQ